MTKCNWIYCNTCGADAFHELSVIDGWHIGRCDKCSQIYLNPMPFFEPSPEFSALSLSFQYTQFQHQITEQVLRHDNMQFEKQLALLSRFAGQNITRGKFLDIGCGSGASVNAAISAGWQAVGIDIDPELVELGKTQLKVDLRCTTLLDSGFEENQFDFIRLRDVIEHLPNPYDVLLEVKRLLVPGGFVLIATPNEDALPTQLRLLLGLKRNKVATVAPPHHVHGFTPVTLTKILERVDLKRYCIKTTTPVDPEYVTARNMASANNVPAVLLWHLGKLIGKGSMLVAWARKEE